jgi:general secretion pathway protein D
MPIRTTIRFLYLIFFAALAGCGTVSDALNPDAIAVTPRLQNNEPERRGDVINAAAFNAMAVEQTMAPYQGYVGGLRTLYEANKGAITQDLNELAQAAPSQFNPNELVTVNFSNASLNYILEQVLRGALGVNYIAPDNLPTVSTFRIDAPIPKSRLLQTLRDLLARHHLVMRPMNGVYHIGPAEVIDAMAANVARSGGDVDGTRVVRLPRGNAQQVAALASQLLTSGVQVIPSSAPDSLILKANASDFASAERMLQALSEAAVGYDEVAILPLSRSAPEAVASQLNEFYAPTLRQDQERVTVVPLQNQQAILVGTSHPSLMRSLVQLVAQLDRTAADRSDLRVIPLTHLRPSQISQQLAEVFGAETASFKREDLEGGARSMTGVRSRLKTPDPIRPAMSPTSSQPGAAAAETAPASPTPVAGTATLPSDIRIVADDRTNSLLVYSSYSVFKRMKEVVQLLDIAQAQVIIEATVVEVQLTDQVQSGVEFLLKYSGLSFGTGTAQESQLFNGATDIGPVNVQAALKALKAVTNLRVVSSPYLTVVDGEAARLVIGDQVPFAVSSQSTIVDGRTTTTSNTEILDTGIVLQITPRIHANNSVSLEVIQSVSTVKPNSDRGDHRPTISTRDITSQILAQSGRTVLLGGLIQERKELTENGVPIASNIPVLGQLFRSNNDDRQRTELLVLITPRVSRASAEIEEITRMLQGVQQFGGYPDLKR